MFRSTCLILLFIVLCFQQVYAQHPAKQQTDSVPKTTKAASTKARQHEKEQNLQEVKIVRAQPVLERKADRIVFNAANSIAAIGADALELLAKIPGVKVQNDRVSLVGKGTVSVMVNDRLVQLTEGDLYTYLKSIPADNISKVELITNPAAKYDAQGNNGLINIVLKKSTKDGLLTTVNLDNSLATHYTAAAGINLNFHQDRLTVYGNMNLRKGSIASTEQTDVFYPVQSWKTLNQFRNFRTVPSGQGGIDYRLNPKTLVGISYHAGHTNFHSEEKISTRISNSLDALDSILVSDAQAKIKSGFHAANLFFKKLLDTTGKQLLVDADWFSYTDDRARYFNNNTYLSDGELWDASSAQYLSASAQQMNIYTVKADLDLPYKTFKLSLGSKISLIRNTSAIAFYQEIAGLYRQDEQQSNVFKYSENTQSVYGNLNHTIQRWAFQLGLRGEYTQTQGVASSNTHQNNYFQLFPTAFVTYQLDKKDIFSLSYGRRINRPNYKKLNPFRWYSNQYAYMEGNPFLKPSFSNNIELSHTYAGLLSSSLSFSQTTAGYSDVNFTAQFSTLQILRPVNFIRSATYQYSNSLALSPTSWWQSNTQVNIFYTVAKSSLPETADLLEGMGAYFSTSNQFYFNSAKTFAADLSCWYQFSGIDGIQRLEKQYNIDLGVKVMLLDKKMQIALNQTDLLKTNKYRYSSTVNQIKQQYENYYDSRQLKLSIRYSFGNDRLKTSTRRPGNEEERKRSN